MCAGAHYLYKVAAAWPIVLWPRDVPQYLWQFVRVADVPSPQTPVLYFRRPDSSGCSNRLTSIGFGAFPVAGHRIWNTLPKCTSPLPRPWLYFLHCTCLVFRSPRIFPLYLDLDDNHQSPMDITFTAMLHSCCMTFCWSLQLPLRPL